MNKKLALLLCLLALGLMGAKTAHLMHLTVVNKSGMKIEVSMTGKVEDVFYYLRLEKGTRQEPWIKTYMIVPDNYSSSIYYMEYWDPVYGRQCASKGQTLDVTRNVTIIVLPCKVTPPNGGEPPGLIKYGGRNIKRGR